MIKMDDCELPPLFSNLQAIVHENLDTTVKEILRGFGLI